MHVNSNEADGASAEEKGTSQEVGGQHVLANRQTVQADWGQGRIVQEETLAEKAKRRLVVDNRSWLGWMPHVELG